MEGKGFNLYYTENIICWMAGVIMASTNQLTAVAHKMQAEVQFYI